jgi:predicted phosphodiesterase
MSFAYPARLLSDLHLGHDVSTIQSVAQLAPLLEGIATLILNGDTVESKLASFRDRSQGMLEELRALASDRGVEVVLLNGNHDPSLWPHDWLDLAEGRVFVTHGHVLLPMVSPWSAKLRACRPAMDAIAAQFTPGDLAQMDQRFERTRRWSETMIATQVRQSGTGWSAKLGMAWRELWPPTRPWNVFKVWANLPRIAGRFVEEFRPACQVMLFGHTHRAAWWRRNGRLLVNTGGFVSFASPLAVEFPNENEVRIRRVDLRNGQFQLGKIVAKETLSKK